MYDTTASVSVVIDSFNQEHQINDTSEYCCPSFSHRSLISLPPPSLTSVVWAKRACLTARSSFPLVIYLLCVEPAIRTINVTEESQHSLPY